MIDAKEEKRLMDNYNNVISKLNEYKNEINRMTSFKKGLSALISDCIVSIKDLFKKAVEAKSVKSFELLVEKSSKFQTYVAKMIEEFERGEESIDVMYSLVSEYKNKTIPTISEKIRKNIIDGV